MITKVHIQNYRSIVDATVKLSPFTLLIGANGTGKSNFLRLLQDVSAHPFQSQFEKHLNHCDDLQKITFWLDDGSKVEFEDGTQNGSLHGRTKIKIFQLNPDNIGQAEELSAEPFVGEDGLGAVRVLDALKTGDREDLFDQIERDFKRFIPEIEKLSFIPNTNVKQLQVREKHINQPSRLEMLSEGTRLILTILTIIYQEKPPKFIGLEEMDRGLHPRLFQQLLELLQYISEERGIQVVATTHNPYLVDEFKNREEAVIIVEKHEGATIFTSLAKKLEHLLPDEEPLGQLWYSGIVGGVPAYAR